MVHSTAIVHPKAQIGSGCEIGPYCVIGEHVTLGDNCTLHSHVVIDGHSRLGKENEIFPFVTLGKKTQDLKFKGGVTRLEIGDRNVFREGVTIHCATSDGDATVVGSDNLLLTYVHIAHDCILGNHIIMSGFAGLAGHVVVEDHAILGGYTAVHQFCRVGRLAMTGGCSRIPQDVPPFMIVEGNPAEHAPSTRSAWNATAFPTKRRRRCGRLIKLYSAKNFPFPTRWRKSRKNCRALPEVQHLVQFIRASERGITK